MTRSPATLVVLFLLIALGIASTSAGCPYGKTHLTGPYTKVNILNKDGVMQGYKLVDEPFIVKVIRRNEDKSETPLQNREVKIYTGREGDGNMVLVASGTTDANGEYKYTPSKVGWYTIKCEGKELELEIKKLYNSPTDFGAVCGNGICESDKMENYENCPEDCSVCGDGRCEGNENKGNCPEDCVICGDGVCDEGEYWPGGCSCPEDCIICGDGICDTAHGENASGCPEDCKGEEKGRDTLGGIIYVLIGAGAGAGGIAYYIARGKKRESEGEGEESGVEEIISELLDTGVPESRIRKKLLEYGVEDERAREMIEKAKKKRED